MRFTVYKILSVLSLILLFFIMQDCRAEIIAQGEYCEGITWELDNEGNMRIQGIGSMADYSYSDEASRPWYAYSKQVTNVIIAEGITHIGDSAFRGFSMMESCHIPESVETIGSHVFYGCTNLATLNLPSKLTEIKDSTFCKCKKLKQINLPAGLVSIGNFAFQECGLTSLVFPESLDIIGNYAFNVCYDLKDVIVPRNAQHISNLAFYGSGATIYIYADSSAADGYTYYEEGDSIGSYFCSPSEPEYLIHKAERADGTVYLTIYDYTGDATEITLPTEIDGVQVRAVECYAFQNAKHLKTVNIPDGFIKIRYSAFYTNEELRTVRVPATVTEINEDAFEKGPTIECYRNSYAHQWAIENNCPFILIDEEIVLGENILHLPENITEIPDEAFINDSSIDTVIIPSKIKSIGAWAFANCTCLKKVYIYNIDISIDKSAFSGCTDVTFYYVRNNIS